MSISRATHSGQLAITNVMLPCYVLDDGMRVLGGEGLLRAFGEPHRTSAKRDASNQPPAFLAQKNLQPFICEQLRKDSTPVHFRTEDGDQAFGYRALCHSPAVQGLLARYLKPFAARWSKRFPDEYYQEIYRLKGWEWPGMGVNRYPITGHITNEIVYARIADGLLDRLRIDNLKTAGGDREHRHHQWLSDDFGVQELREHIVGVLAIMRTVVDPDPKRA